MKIHDLLNIFSSINNPKVKLKLYNYLEDLLSNNIDDKEKEESKNILKEMKPDLLYYDFESEYYRHGIIDVNSFHWCYPNEQNKLLKDLNIDIMSNTYILVDNENFLYTPYTKHKDKVYFIYDKNLLPIIKIYMELIDEDRILFNGKCLTFTEIEKIFMGE